MGKGDIRTKRGKIARGTYGSKRSRSKQRRKKNRSKDSAGDKR
ncbi:MAG: 30S ribosomal protein THX [Gammaproteobacteria bacterium]|nr:30S ribosomal protein THX [Gammaproteobacteria bacterium]